MGKICNLNRKTYIYVLEDPETKEVKYVGKTVSSLKHRLSQHLNDFRGKSYKSNWIRKLKSKNLIPIIKIIDIVTWEDSAKVEMYWIQYFSEYFNLTNLSLGGEGALGNIKTEEQILKLRKSLRKNSRPVYKYTLKGKFLSKYNSCAEAAEILSLRRENINQCCLFKKKSHGNFIWSYNPPNIFDFSKYIHDKVDYSKRDNNKNTFFLKRKIISITHMDSDMEIITNSMKDASFITGVSLPSISRECNFISPTVGRFRFKFK